MCWILSSRLSAFVLGLPAAPDVTIAPAATTAPATSARRAPPERKYRILPPQSLGCRADYEVPASRNLGSRADRVVRPPLRAQDVADLADRAARPQRLAHRREEVALAAGRLAHGLERPRRLARPLCADARRPLEL